MQIEMSQECFPIFSVPFANHFHRIMNSKQKSWSEKENKPDSKGEKYLASNKFQTGTEEFVKNKTSLPFQHLKFHRNNNKKCFHTILRKMKRN